MFYKSECAGKGSSPEETYQGIKSRSTYGSPLKLPSMLLHGSLLFCPYSNKLLDFRVIFHLRSRCNGSPRILLPISPALTHLLHILSFNYFPKWGTRAFQSSGNLPEVLELRYNRRNKQKSRWISVCHTQLKCRLSSPYAGSHALNLEPR